MAVALVVCLIALVTVAVLRRRRISRIVPSKPPFVSGAIVPSGIVLHSSDSPARWHKIIVNAKTLDRIHRDDHPGWATTYQGKVYHIGYHFVVLPNGKVETGRPLGCIGAHAKHHNTWIGICVIGAFSVKSNPHWWPQRPTAAQVKSVEALCEGLMIRYHIPPEKVVRHRDVNDTRCPGGRFPYGRIIKVLQRFAKTHPEVRLPNEVRPTPEPPGTPPASR